jgi:putative ATPase
MKIITKARSNFANNKPTIVFLDEIHRWNKAQQDTLLPFVEKGIVSLIGATTENPSFTINNALLSRCRVFRLDALGSEDIVVFIEKNREKISEQYRDVTYMRETLDIIARSS